MEKSCKKGDNVIVKIHYSAISTACMRWVYYDQFIGICFKVEDEASVYFLNAILRDIQDSECYINYNSHE